MLNWLNYVNLLDFLVSWAMTPFRLVKPVGTDTLVHPNKSVDLFESGGLG